VDKDRNQYGISIVLRLPVKEKNNKVSKKLLSPSEQKLIKINSIIL
jgi:hypothetical protein